jgi:hypothetical protein
MPSISPIENYLVTLPDSVKGLNTAWASNTTLTVSAGICRDSTNTFDMTLAATATISAAAIGANGLDTGTLGASTYYYVFIIGSSIGSAATACLISTSATQPYMPKGYDIFRRIGVVLTDGSSHFLKFYQTGSYSAKRYQYDALVPFSAITSATWVAQSLTAAIPPVAQIALMNAAYTPAVAGNGFGVRPTGSSVSVTYAPIQGTGVVAAKAQTLPYFEVTPLLSSGNLSIDVIVTSSDSLVLGVIGFIDSI